MTVCRLSSQLDYSFIENLGIIEWTSEGVYILYCIAMFRPFFFLPFFVTIFQLFSSSFHYISTSSSFPHLYHSHIDLMLARTYSSKIGFAFSQESSSNACP